MEGNKCNKIKQSCMKNSGGTAVEQLNVKQVSITAVNNFMLIDRPHFNTM